MFVSANADDCATERRALRITPLERRALQMLATGHTTGGVAAGLGISALETETLLAALFAAMGASTRVQAVAAARRRGLLV
jgi:DNA-binding CsgD family transcriptional regulator